MGAADRFSTPRAPGSLMSPALLAVETSRKEEFNPINVDAGPFHASICCIFPLLDDDIAKTYVDGSA